MIVWTLRHIVAAATVLAASGCAQQLMVPVQMPAASVDAMHLKTVSVAQIEGDRYGAVADAVEQFLTQLRVDQRPWFRVIHPTSGRWSRQAEALRASTASDFAVYTGQVTQWETPSERYTKQGRRCVTRKSGGGFFKKCLRWEPYQVSCLKRAALFGANIKAISARTGQVVHSVDINASVGDSGCGDRIAAVAPATQMMKQAVNSAIAKLNCEFAPCVMKQKLQLMSDTSGLSTPEAKTRFSSAYDYTIKSKGQGLKAACSEWIKLAEVKREETVPLLFNVASCNEVNGEFDQAMTYLNRAKAMYLGINPEIETAIGRVQEARKRREILRQQKSGSAHGS